ncbi:vWA domain-containing protein [Liberiplasma polymorphum]|uniref:vWA domain-containing protein n=1 Tax=Liberiplasma polymorphum TaxID=3374570 RepID=UPI003774DFC2
MDFTKYVKNEAKPLPVILLLDTSGSMHGEKIITMNHAVKEMINDFQNQRLTEVRLQVAIITFGGSANLHLDLKNVNEINYKDFSASGMTPLGAALNIAVSLINDKEKVTSKGYKPTVILVSDGMPNDAWEQPLNNFLENKRSSKCERWALGIGNDVDKEMLKQFLNDPEKPVFDASQAKEISSFFKFVTMSTIARSQSVNPNESIDLEELSEIFKKDKPNFEF